MGYRMQHCHAFMVHSRYRALITIILVIFYHRFDLFSFDIPNRPEDETGLFAAVRQINKLIDAEIESGIPPHRVIVGGLSQGAALSVLTGLATDRKLAGIFALSGYIPLRGKTISASSLTFDIAVYKDNRRLNRSCPDMHPSIQLYPSVFRPRHC